VWGLVKAIAEGVVSGVTKWREAKKRELEIEGLEHEKKVRESRIVPATMKDVKEYDPKAKKLRLKIQMRDPGARRHLRVNRLLIGGFASTALIVFLLLMMFSKKNILLILKKYFDF